MQVQPRRKPTKTIEVANELTQDELDKVSAGKADQFLKIDGIQGESQTSSHADWIQLLSWNH